MVIKKKAGGGKKPSPKGSAAATSTQQKKSQKSQEHRPAFSDEDDDENNNNYDDDDFTNLRKDAAQKTYVPEDNEMPTSSQLASAKSSLLPFVGSKDAAASSSSSTTNKKGKAQQLLEEDTDAAAILVNDDDEIFESGIVESREAHEQAQTRKDLITEARMRRGLEITEIADRVDIGGLALFGRKTLNQDAASSSSSSNHRFWGHNRNTITCVAATPPNLVVHTALAGVDGAAAAASNIDPEDLEIEGETGWSTGSKMLCCFGDKSGRTWVILDDSTAEKNRVALDPPQRGAVLCVAISDAPPAPTLSNERISLVATKMERYIIAAGASDGTIYFWSGITLQHRGHVNLHRQPVTGLAFKAGAHILYSVSKDAVLRVWDALEAPARSVDKLYGHTSAALCVTSPTTSFLESANATRHTSGGGRCISGGDDRVPRYWKVESATESEFREPIDFHNENRINVSAGSVECICVVGIGGANNLAFAVGTSNGTLALYDVNKRTPLWMQERAHGSDVQGDGTGLEGPMQILQRQLEKRNAAAATNENKNENNNNTQNQNQIRTSGSGNPITAIAAVPCGDVVATGSGDGFVRLWKVTFDEGRVSRIGVASATKIPARLDLLCEIKTPGWVNGLSFSYTGGIGSSKQWYLYITSSKEQRLGRWVVFSKVLNGVLRFPLLVSASTSSAIMNKNQQKKNKHLPHQDDHDEDEDEEIEEDFVTSVQSQKSLAQLRNKFLQSPEKRSMTKSQKQKLNKKASKSSLGEKQSTSAVSAMQNEDNNDNNNNSDDDDDQQQQDSSSSPTKQKMTLEEKKKKLLLLRKKKLLALKKK